MCVIARDAEGRTLFQCRQTKTVLSSSDSDHDDIEQPVKKSRISSERLAEQLHGPAVYTILME